MIRTVMFGENAETVNAKNPITAPVIVTCRKENLSRNIPTIGPEKSKCLYVTRHDISRNMIG